ncbi:MAG: hypothetical protein SFW36_19930, partial [Leptolyngbyaceae cyanobacterium bins.59]|nr:hypothetical protein [Leptolyngbyaceae cyanobacterium bins.59]
PEFTVQIQVYAKFNLPSQQNEHIRSSSTRGACSNPKRDDSPLQCQYNARLFDQFIDWCLSPISPAAGDISSGTLRGLP